MKTMAQIKEERKQKNIETYQKYFDAIHTNKIVWKVSFRVGKFNKDTNFFYYQNYLYATVNDEIVAEIYLDEFKKNHYILKNYYQESMKDVIDEFPVEFENYLFLDDDEIDAVFEKEVAKASLVVERESLIFQKEFDESCNNFFQQVNKLAKMSKLKIKRIKRRNKK